MMVCFGMREMRCCRRMREVVVGGVLGYLEAL